MKPLRTRDRAELSAPVISAGGEALWTVAADQDDDAETRPFALRGQRGLRLALRPAGARSVGADAGSLRQGLVLTPDGFISAGQISPALTPIIANSIKYNKSSSFCRQEAQQERCGSAQIL